MTRAKCELRDPPLYGPVWTDERVQILRGMWVGGKSTREISIELGGGTTRLAVIGKAHRIGLPPHPRRHAHSGKRVSPAQNLNELAAKEAICAERREELKRERIEGVPASVGSRPCTIDELQARGNWANCHWPLGGNVKDRHKYFYCGAPAELEQGKNPPRPYCQYHRIMRNFGQEAAERSRKYQETADSKQCALAMAS